MQEIWLGFSTKIKQSFIGDCKGCLLGCSVVFGYVCMKICHVVLFEGRVNTGTAFGDSKLCLSCFSCSGHWNILYDLHFFVSRLNTNRSNGRITLVNFITWRDTNNMHHNCIEITQELSHYPFHVFCTLLVAAPNSHYCTVVHIGKHASIPSLEVNM